MNTQNPPAPQAAAWQAKACRQWLGPNHARGQDSTGGEALPIEQGTVREEHKLLTPQLGRSLVPVLLPKLG